jgi:hypothetical protein
VTTLRLATWNLITPQTAQFFYKDTHFDRLALEILFIQLFLTDLTTPNVAKAGGFQNHARVKL